MKNKGFLTILIEVLTIPVGIMKWGCTYHNWIADKGMLIEIGGGVLASAVLFFVVLLFFSIIFKSLDQDRRTNYYSKRFFWAIIGTMISLFIWFQIYDTFCCSNPNICCAKLK